ncbi:hypothetical protein K7X08_034872 [Anisodus acutangulus]|uniref:CASP-like protein n=1 Tax=Anisodus acutangulus TaxID=402998 RepID=A0A9Q1LJK6_9SOLA|nr:hypothetical protein K7X08_034872 [Anisodus acutangulus]
MASSRGIIKSILALRILTLLFCAASLALIVISMLRGSIKSQFRSIKSYRYVLAAAAGGILYSLIQLPFAMYHAIKEKRLIRGKFLPMFDFYGDKPKLKLQKEASFSALMESSVTNKSQKMAGTVHWGTATVIGVFAGMFYGGSKEAAASVSKDAEVMLKLGSTPDKREQYRLMRDAMEKRFIRRGVHDVYNVVAAGSATAATFGLIMPGSLQWRARNVMLGSALGAAVCFPLGWLHLKLVEKANEGTDN